MYDTPEKTTLATLTPEMTGNGPLKLLSLRVGSVEYLVPVREVTKVVMANTLEDDSLAPACMCGAMTYNSGTRDRGAERLGVVDLRERFSVETETPFDRSTGCVVVVEYDDMPVGFLVDGFDALHDVPRSSLQKSELIDDLSDSRKVAYGFVSVDDATYEVLCLRQLLCESELDSIRSWKRAEEAVLRKTLAQQQTVSDDDADVDPDVAQHAGFYLIARLGNDLFGISTTDIVEITPTDGMTDLPLTDADFAGVLRLRNNSFPVLDLARHFGFDQGVDPDQHSSIVFVSDGDAETGLLVQRIVRLCRITPTYMRDRSHAKVSIHKDLLHGVAAMDLGPIYLLNIKALLTDSRDSIIDGSRDALAAARSQGLDMAQLGLMGDVDAA